MKLDSAVGSLPGIELDVMLSGHSLIDFDKRQIRKALNKGGAEVRTVARRLVSRRAISNPDEYPGMDSGALKRSITIYKRGSRGGWIKVGPTKTSEMNAFYPAFLYYGTRGLGRIQRVAPGEGRGKSNRRRAGARAALVEERKSVSDYVIARRANYMADALNSKRQFIRENIRIAMPAALIPRK